MTSARSGQSLERWSCSGEDSPERREGLEGCQRGLQLKGCYGGLQLYFLVINSLSHCLQLLLTTHTAKQLPFGSCTEPGGPHVLVSPSQKSHITNGPKDSPSQIITLPPDADVTLGSANGEQWLSEETASDNANQEKSVKEKYWNFPSSLKFFHSNDERIFCLFYSGSLK